MRRTRLAVVDTKVEALRVAAAATAAAGPSSSHRRGKVERAGEAQRQERLNEEVAAAEDASNQPPGRSARS